MKITEQFRHLNCSFMEKLKMRMIIGTIVIWGIIIGFLILMVMIPIKVAESRGVKGQSLTTIKVLSWLGLLLLIPWFVALIMSLVCEVQKSASLSQKMDYLKELELLTKLNELKENGVITQEEYETKKKELITNSNADSDADNIKKKKATKTLWIILAIVISIPVVLLTVAVAVVGYTTSVANDSSYSASQYFRTGEDIYDFNN